MFHLFWLFLPRTSLCRHMRFVSAALRLPGDILLFGTLFFEIASAVLSTDSWLNSSLVGQANLAVGSHDWQYQCNEANLFMALPMAAGMFWHLKQDHSSHRSHCISYFPPVSHFTHLSSLFIVSIIRLLPWPCVISVLESVTGVSPVAGVVDSWLVLCRMSAHLIIS